MADDSGTPRGLDDGSRAQRPRRTWPRSRRACATISRAGSMATRKDGAGAPSRARQALLRPGDRTARRCSMTDSAAGDDRGDRRGSGPGARRRSSAPDRDRRCRRLDRQRGSSAPSTTTSISTSWRRRTAGGSSTRCGAGPMDTVRAPERPDPRPREQSRARYPDRTGFVERPGGLDRVRGVRHGRAADRVRAAVADRPLAHLEGPDPLLRAAAPRRRLGQPRQRPLRSAARPARPHDPGRAANLGR